MLLTVLHVLRMRFKNRKRGSVSALPPFFPGELEAMSDVLGKAGTVGDTWFPTVKQVDSLLSDLYALEKSGVDIGSVIDDLLDYRNIRALEEKFIGGR